MVCHLKAKRAWHKLEVRGTGTSDLRETREEALWLPGEELRSEGTKKTQAGKTDRQTQWGCA